MDLIELNNINQTLIVSLRLLPVFLFSAVFAFKGIPLNVKILLSIGFALVSAGIVSSQVIFPKLTPIIVFTEIMFGLFIVLAINITFSTFQNAGRMLDLTIGLSTANLIDPSTKEMGALFGVFLNLLAIIMFFSINGHHALLKAIFSMYETYPPGSLLQNSALNTILILFSQSFAYAFMLITPIITAVFIIDLIMAVSAKSMPQLNIFILSIPIKITVGIIVLAISLQYLIPLVNRIFSNLFISLGVL
ncbi:flagellar biosynthetic protein FliR [Marinicellulosiphila megalodicopiae]|uniref:flagellar biosynthetic protein FliR n=1 Tax=Marinicellulosiphila megalodicopiae TaxID=2724896 RepID=UPI003BAFCBFA